mmetsp:Transcript_34703/g.68532  ORF Transcript_34703/g.68532 Transcript_34703/m.68532 type:complete len:496 (+) Transcript_34703:279-1766(+)
MSKEKEKKEKKMANQGLFLHQQWRPFDYPLEALPMDYRYRQKKVTIDPKNLGVRGSEDSKSGLLGLDWMADGGRLITATDAQIVLTDPEKENWVLGTYKGKYSGGVYPHPSNDSLVATIAGDSTGKEKWSPQILDLRDGGRTRPSASGTAGPGQTRGVAPAVLSVAQPAALPGGVNPAAMARAGLNTSTGGQGEQKTATVKATLPVRNLLPEKNADTPPQSKPRCACWRNDGHLFAVVVSSREERICLYDVRSLYDVRGEQKPALVLDSPEVGEVTDLTFTGDGQLLVYAMNSGEVEACLAGHGVKTKSNQREWAFGDEFTNRAKRTVHPAAINRVAADRQNRFIVTASNDCSVSVLSSLTLEPQQVFASAEAPVTSLSVNYDGTLVAFGTEEDTRIRVGGLDTGYEYAIVQTAAYKDEEDGWYRIGLVKGEAPSNYPPTPGVEHLAWNPKENVLAYSLDQPKYDKWTKEKGSLCFPTGGTLKTVRFDFPEPLVN